MVAEPMSSSPPPVLHSCVICIGAGLSGLALAIRLQQTMKFRDIHLYDREDGPGGVWKVQKYPGVACDIPADFYSFSFSPTSTGWTKFRPDGREFEQYLRDTATKYDLWPLMTLNTNCEGAEWDEEKALWLVTLRDQASQRIFHHTCNVLCIANGNLTTPKSVNIPNLDTFKGGPIVHTSRWDNSIEFENKNVVVFGNGASGSQVIPHILPKVASLIHVIRSPQWYITPTNFPYGNTVKWILHYIPLARKALRFIMFLVAELAYRGSFMNARATRTRQKWEEKARRYIKTLAPRKYHDILIPKYSMGCKRPVFNGGYLECLHNPKINLAMHDEIELLPTGILYEDREHPVDLIILATGYSTNSSTTPFPIVGRNGQTLSDHWEKMGGPTAYGTIAAHGFPNLFLVKGPNTGTGHTSTILVIENVISLILGVMKPLIRGTARVVEVKKDAEKEFTISIQNASREKVWYAGCTSWYIRDDGWNGSLYPWSQIYCWWFNLFPRWKDWNLST